MSPRPKLVYALVLLLLLALFFVAVNTLGFLGDSGSTGDSARDASSAPEPAPQTASPTAGSAEDPANENPATSDAARPPGGSTGDRMGDAAESGLGGDGPEDEPSEIARQARGDDRTEQGTERGGSSDKPPEKVISGRSSGMDEFAAEWTQRVWGTDRSMSGREYTRSVGRLVTKGFWVSPGGELARTIGFYRDLAPDTRYPGTFQDNPLGTEEIPTAAVMRGMEIVAGPPVGTEADVGPDNVPRDAQPGEGNQPIVPLEDDERSGVASEVIVRFEVGERYGDVEVGEDPDELYGKKRVMEQRLVIVAVARDPGNPDAVPSPPWLVSWSGEARGV